MVNTTISITSSSSMVSLQSITNIFSMETSLIEVHSLLSACLLSLLGSRRTLISSI